MDDGHAVLTKNIRDPLTWPTDDASRVPLWVYSDRANYQRAFAFREDRAEHHAAVVVAARRDVV